MTNSSNPTPFSEPPWLNGLPSPFYNESHREWQKYCRAFFTKNLTSHALQWEREGQLPDELYSTFAKSNMLIPILPSPLPAAWLKKVGIHKIGPVHVEDFDYTHFSVFASEMVRCGLNGPGMHLTGGFAYGIPPLLDFGSKALQQKAVPDILLGRKRICVAVTEPDAGSDVAGIRTTAKLSEDGKFYVVNGAKKWITGGIWSDWACLAARTGGPGAGGISLLLVPLKGHNGVTMRHMNLSGLKCSGTTFIELDDVKVPVENLIGEEGKGMKYTMTNFNHERLTIAVKVTTQARVALASAFEYCMKREAFGAPLINQPVVRNRLARAGGLLEAQWAWIESFIYQMKHLPKKEADERLGGLTGLAKAQSGLVVNECALSAQLLFGGNGYTQSGPGELIEKIVRDVPGTRIAGGSEDVMFDLAIRQLYKLYRAGLKANL